MPAQPSEVAADVLEREIGLLLPAVDAGRGLSSGQKKSELAVLLYEAHRSGAFTIWGYNNLGHYAAKKLGLNPKTFAKYKAAGKVLHDAQRSVYDAVIAAVVGSTRRPRLPPVSQLAAMPSLEKQVGREHGVTELLDDGAPLGKIKILAEMTSYGEATAEGRRTLSDLDGFVQEAKRALALLQGPLPGSDDLPADQLALRFAHIRDACEVLLRVVEQLEADQG